MRVKCVLLSILSKHWGFEVAAHILYFSSAVFVCSSINKTDIIEQELYVSKIAHLFIYFSRIMRKKNNVVSEQVLHKPSCTITEVP